MPVQPNCFVRCLLHLSTTSLPDPIGKGRIVVSANRRGPFWLFLDSFDPEVLWRARLENNVRYALNRALDPILGIRAPEAHGYVDAAYPTNDDAEKRTEHIFWMTPVLPDGVDDHGPPHDND